MKHLIHQFAATLGRKTRFGVSKKADRRRSGQHRPDAIYSYSTFQSYLAACKCFCAWVSLCFPEVETMEEAKGYVPAYLYECAEGGLSAWTVSLYAAALAKAYGCASTEWGVSLQRRREDIKRSRLPAARDCGFSEKNNKGLAALCRGVGVRREDLEFNVEACDFFEHKGFWWLHVPSGKGGRERWSVVLPEYAEEIMRIVAEAKASRGPHGKLFASIPSHADIHGYRRKYAQRLYALCAEDPLFCAYLQELLGAHPKAKSKVYHGRGTAKGESWNRAALAVVSVSMGHGPDRATTVVNHYLR